MMDDRRETGELGDPASRARKGTRSLLHRHRALLLICCIALAARLAYAWVALPLVAEFCGFSTSRGSDGYHQIAKCLLAGKGYRFYPECGETMFRLPGYPAFVWFLYWAFGVRLWIVQIVQSVLAACTCALIYRMGKRYLGRRIGLLAGLAFALWPLDIVVSARIVTEPLYILIVALSMTVLLRLAEEPRLRFGVALGCLLGLGNLVRETNVFLAAALAAAIPCLGLAKGRRLKYLSALMICVVVAAGVMAPWIVRGYRLTGSLVLPTTAGGLGLFKTVVLSKNSDYNCDRREHTKRTISPAVLQVLASHAVRVNREDYASRGLWTFKSIEDEFRAHRVLKREAIKAIHADPMRFMRTVGGNALGFWFRGMTRRMNIIARLMFTPVLILGFIGFVAAIRSGQKAAWILAFLIVYFNTISAPSIAFMRYTLPATPALLLLAARGLGCVFPRGPNERGRRAKMKEAIWP